MLLPIVQGRINCTMASRISHVTSHASDENIFNTQEFYFNDHYWYFLQCIKDCSYNEGLCMVCNIVWRVMHVKWHLQFRNARTQDSPAEHCIWTRWCYLHHLSILFIFGWSVTFYHVFFTGTCMFSSISTCTCTLSHKHVFKKRKITDTSW